MYDEYLRLWHLDGLSLLYGTPNTLSVRVSCCAYVSSKAFLCQGLALVTFCFEERSIRCLPPGILLFINYFVPVDVTKITMWERTMNSEGHIICRIEYLLWYTIVQEICNKLYSLYLFFHDYIVRSSSLESWKSLHKSVFQSWICRESRWDFYPFVLVMHFFSNLILYNKQNSSFLLLHFQCITVFNLFKIFICFFFFFMRSVSTEKK